MRGATIGLVAGIGLAIAALPPVLARVLPMALPPVVAQGAGYIPGYGLLVGECAHSACLGWMVEAVVQAPGPDRDDRSRRGAAAARLGIEAFHAHATVYPFVRAHAEQRVLSLNQMTYLIRKTASP